MDEKTELEFQSLLSAFEENNHLFGDILEGLRNHVVPESYSQFPGDILYPSQLEASTLILRDSFLMSSGYSLVAYDWVRPLARWIGNRRCIEVMCGCGCLTKALQDCGVDIIATDDLSWQNHNECWFRNPWTNIEQLDAVSAVRKYGQSVEFIIMSWPYMDNTAHEVLLEMRSQTPAAMMIFVGEWGGATADEKFFTEAQIVNDPEFDIAVTKYRQHATIHDKPYLLR